MRLQKQKDTRPFSLSLKMMIILVSIATYIGGFLFGLIVADTSFSALTAAQRELVTCKQRLFECSAINVLPPHERRNN